MKKILLIIEDYNEMTKTQTYLKKIGFDVVAQGAETRLQEQILTFFPDLILAHGENKKVNSLSVGQKIKDYGKFQGKAILVLPHGSRPTPTELAKVKMDALLEAPIHPIRFIQVASKLLGIDPNPLVEKYNRAYSSTAQESIDVHSKPNEKPNAQTVSGGPTPSFQAMIPTIEFDMKKEAATDKARIEKYSKLVSGLKFNKTETSHDKKSIKDKWNELKKDWDMNLLKEIDALKQQFAAALFKKK